MRQLLHDLRRGLGGGGVAPRVAAAGLRFLQLVLQPGRGPGSHREAMEGECEHLGWALCSNWLSAQVPARQATPATGQGTLPCMPARIVAGPARKSITG